ARSARGLVHAARKHDRRLSAALLAAAVAHTPEAEEVLRGARTRMARKPSALSRELLRNFPKGGKRGRSRRRRKKGNGTATGEVAAATENGQVLETGLEVVEGGAAQRAERVEQPDDVEKAEAVEAIEPPSDEEAVGGVNAALQSLLAAKAGSPGDAGDGDPAADDEPEQSVA